jgi:hypothetical protein
MKIILPILCIFYVLMVQAYAQTNFDVLVCANASYTNATIVRATPAYVVVDFDGGIAKVCLTNLPPLLQEKYHYDPAAAAKALADETARLKAARSQVAAQQLAQQKYLASLVGTNETVKVSDIFEANAFGGTLCQMTEGKVLIAGLKEDLIDFLVRKKQLTQAIADFSDKIDRDQINADNAEANAPTSVMASGSEAFVDAAMASANAQANTANNMESYVQREQIALGRMQDELAQMQSKEDAMTTITAYPTGQSYGGNPIWQCSQ